MALYNSIPYGFSVAQGAGVQVSQAGIYGSAATIFNADVAPANTVIFTPSLGAN